MAAYVTRYADLIRSASEAEIRADVTLSGRLVLDRSGPINVSYAPFEHIQRGARIVIVGITPGAQQACNALCALRKRLVAGDTHAQALAAAKIFASFSGSMRVNLIDMLDYIGIAKWLGVASTVDLWTGRSDLVHFTSALRYPVFVGGANYNGTPPMVRTPILTRLLDECLAEESAALPDAVWVPLGGKAEAGVQHLVRKGLIQRERVLSGMLHPSSANNERVHYFVDRKSRAALSPKTNPNIIDPLKASLIGLVSKL